MLIFALKMCVLNPMNIGAYGYMVEVHIFLCTSFTLSLNILYTPLYIYTVKHLSDYTSIQLSI